MDLTHVSVTLRPLPKSRKKYQDLFLVDTGATDSMAPGKSLKKAGIQPIGKMAYEQLGSSVHPGRHSDERRGDQGNSHLSP